MTDILAAPLFPSGHQHAHAVTALPGWNLSVCRQQNHGTPPAVFGALHGERLAMWQTALGGPDWLDELVRRRKAVFLEGNNSPVEHTAVAADIIPRIRTGRLEARAAWIFNSGDVLSPAWLGKTPTGPALMDAGRPGEWLLIQAWDGS